MLKVTSLLQIVCPDADCSSELLDWLITVIISLLHSIHSTWAMIVNKYRKLCDITIAHTDIGTVIYIYRIYCADLELLYRNEIIFDIKRSHTYKMKFAVCLFLMYLNSVHKNDND